MNHTSAFGTFEHKALVLSYFFALINQINFYFYNLFICLSLLIKYKIIFGSAPNYRAIEIRAKKARLWSRPRNLPNPENVEMCLNRITRHLRLFRGDGLGKSVSSFADGTSRMYFLDFLTDLRCAICRNIETNMNYDMCAYF